MNKALLMWYIHLYIRLLTKTCVFVFLRPLNNIHDIYMMFGFKGKTLTIFKIN